jgi:hypothetical protein
MAGGKLWGAWLALAALVAGYASVSTTADAQLATPIAVGTVGSNGQRAEDRAAFHDALTTELASVGTLRVTEPRRARYIVRGSVVRLERRPLSRGHEVQCEVSLIVSEARGETVRLTLMGRAGARGEGAVERVERLALQAALRSAIRPLPNGLETTELETTESEASQGSDAPGRRPVAALRVARRS